MHVFDWAEHLLLRLHLYKSVHQVLRPNFITQLWLRWVVFTQGRWQLSFKLVKAPGWVRFSLFLTAIYKISLGTPLMRLWEILLSQVVALDRLSSTVANILAHAMLVFIKFKTLKIADPTTYILKHALWELDRGALHFLVACENLLLVTQALLTHLV